MTSLYFIRHGQTAYNLALKYQGQTDIALTVRGLAEGDCVANRLASESIQAIYSSPLQRAVVTANKIAAYHDLPVKVSEYFREINFGELEGKTPAECQEIWPEFMTTLLTTPGEAALPGGEDFSSFGQRISQGICDLVSHHPDQNVLVVAHGGAIRTALCLAMGISLNRVWDIKQDNTAINIVEYHRDRTVLALVNDTLHLKNLLGDALPSLF